MQIIAQWTGAQADALRRALRMTIEGFADHLHMSARAVAYWRERPAAVPQSAIQRALDATLEAAPDRAKTQFSLLLSAMNDEAPPSAPPLAKTVDALGPNPDEQARIRGVLRTPSHLDRATVEHLTRGLYGQRHAEDSLGPDIMLGPMSAQLELLKTLLRQTTGPHRPALMHLVANWTTFIAWLHTERQEYTAADAVFTEAEIMADELGDGIISSTATSYRGYLALLQGHHRAALRFTHAALGTPGIHPTHFAYDTMQAAQVYAGLGNRNEATDLLRSASDLVTEVSDPPDSLYWYTKPFLRMEIGLTQHAIGQYRDAADSIASGMTELPADQQNAEWLDEYTQALEDASARADGSSPRRPD